MITDVKEKLTSLKESKSPTVLVMGALGRCGRGAVDFFKKIGIPECDAFSKALNHNRSL